MRVLSLDFDPVYGEDTVRAAFAGDISVFDFDLVIWDPGATLSWYIHSRALFKGLPALSDNMSVHIESDIVRRRAEFLEFVNSGRTLVVITRPPQECYAATGDVNHSGTGRNRTSTRVVAKVDLLSALPLGEMKFTKAAGTRIEIDGDGPFAALLRKYKDDLRYEAIIINPPGTKLAHVSGTDKVIASMQGSKQGGHLIFLPTVDLRRVDAEEDESNGASDNGENDEPALIYRKGAWKFEKDLIDAVRWSGGSTELSRPPWARHYSTAEQRRISGEVVKQQTRIETARKKFARLKHQSQTAEARDQLYLGTGRALELEVRAVFEAMGGEVTEPEPGRDDWRVTFPEFKAVIEVKGISKSAAEKHAAQLEKWVATELERSGSAPKGVLVANTWKDKPLMDRTDADFPTQMLPYSVSRGHCLITGLQLFAILADLEADPSKKEHWRTAIQHSAGVLSGTPDWRDVIQVSEEKAEEG